MMRAGEDICDGTPRVQNMEKSVGGTPGETTGFKLNSGDGEQYDGQY